ncbi:EpsG family protein [Bacillus pacificus]|uniref:EpsG family protein n=1 Tax=Bacillus cereus group sp. BfR-BA-01326 TaxID=2920302 RepID=UPI001F56B95C|nr:EpsG family protein [Bacillus cereus group sp. BfR-BA-01326]
MIFYFSWFIVVFLLLAFKKQKNRINIIVVFVLFTLVYGIRDYGGVDDLTYITAFNNAISGDIVYGLEGSYLVISKFLGSLGFNYKAVFLTYATISFTFMYLAFKELCKYKHEWIIVMLGFLVFAFFPTITVMRQFAAAATLTYALTLKFQGRKKLPLVFIGLASVIHVGSVIGFLIYPLFFINLKSVFKAVIPIICLGIGYFGILNSLFSAFNLIIPSKYIGYLDGNITNPDIGVLHIILFTIYLCQFALAALYKGRKALDRKVNFLENAQMIYFSLFFITLSSGWASRLSMYFILFIPFTFITFISRFSLERDRQILYKVCYGACALLFIYQILNLSNSTDVSDLLPYKWSLEFFR